MKSVGMNDKSYVFGKLIQITDFSVNFAVMDKSIKSTGRAYLGTLYWFQIIGNAIIEGRQGEQFVPETEAAEEESAVEADVSLDMLDD